MAHTAVGVRIAGHLKASPYDLTDHQAVMGDLLGAVGDMLIGDGWAPVPTLLSSVVARHSTSILDSTPLDAQYRIERILTRLLYSIWRFPGSVEELLGLLSVREDELSLLTEAWRDAEIAITHLAPGAAAVELRLAPVNRFNLDLREGSRYQVEPKKAIARLATAAESAQLRALIARIHRADMPAEDWLRGYYDRHPSDADAASALGTFLTMSDRWDEAFTSLDRADAISADEDVFARVMYVVCAKKLGIKPSRGLEDSLQRILGEWASPFDIHPDNSVDIHLLAWGVEPGQSAVA